MEQLVAIIAGPMWTDVGRHRCNVSTTPPENLINVDLRKIIAITDCYKRRLKKYFYIKFSLSANLFTEYAVFSVVELTKHYRF